MADTGTTESKPAQETDNPETVPLNTVPVPATDDGNNNGQPPQNGNGISCIAPSAPPVAQPSAPPLLEADQDLPVLPPYQRTESAPGTRPIAEPLHGADHPFYRIESEQPADDGARMRAMSGGPPAYDEHHLDPRIHLEMNGPSVDQSDPSAWF